MHPITRSATARFALLAPWPRRALTGEMHYAGYPATAPFAGVMSGPLGAMKIGVLDNTGGRMIIYNGRATLGPPATIGQFVSVWG
jgi:hypothetical protein